jgi:hypothetical protein
VRAAAVMILLVLFELLLAFLFVFLFLTGRGYNFLLGTLLGAQFLLLGAMMICYLRVRLPVQEITEDRDEGLLW